MTLGVFVFTSLLTKGLFQQKRPVAPAPAATRAGGQGAPVQTPPEAPPSPPADVPRLSQEELAQWRTRYADAWKRNPFFTAEEEALLASGDVTALPAPPSPVAVPALPSYTVKMVLIFETSRVAAIDGRLVSEGEMLGEERVVEIQPDGVVLERAGQRRRVKVAGGDVSLIEVGPPVSRKER